MSSNLVRALILLATVMVKLDVFAMGVAQSDGSAPVVAIIPVTETDLIVLSGGHDRGFRPGTVCNVIRQGKTFGAVVIAEANLHRSVGLILSLEKLYNITLGDIVTPRTNSRI